MQKLIWTWIFPKGRLASKLDPLSYLSISTLLFLLVIAANSLICKNVNLFLPACRHWHCTFIDAFLRVVEGSLQKPLLSYIATACASFDTYADNLLSVK